MKGPVFLLLTAALLALPPVSAAAETYLEATFDDKTVDQPIGTGGAEVGEPITVNEGDITAIVRAGPTPTRCIEIRDVDNYMAGAVTFEFLGSQEVTSGFLSIAVNLWFHELGPGRQFTLYVREQGGAACTFASLNFLEDGRVYLDDAAHPGDLVGDYVTGKIFPVVLNFYLEAGTYDLWLDGRQVVSQQAHGVAGCGIGSIMIGCSNDADLEGVLSVDGIRVTDFHQEVGSEPLSWGRVRSLYR